MGCEKKTVKKHKKELKWWFEIKLLKVKQQNKWRTSGIKLADHLLLVIQLRLVCSVFVRYQSQKLITFLFPEEGPRSFRALILNRLAFVFLYKIFKSVTSFFSPTQRLRYLFLFPLGNSFKIADQCEKSCSS